MFLIWHYLFHRRPRWHCQACVIERSIEIMEERNERG